MSFSNYLKKIRSESGLSTRAFAEKAWVQTATISQIELWKVKSPEDKIVKILINTLGIKKSEAEDTVNWIKAEEAKSKMSPEKVIEVFGATCVVPVYSSIWAWYWRLPDEILDKMPIPETLFRKKSKLFYAKVSWNSMLPKIEDWDFVLIDTSQREVINGNNIFAVQYNHDEATVKRLKVDWDNIYLIPDNQKYETKIVTINDEEFRILWRVINVNKTL